MRGRSLGYRRHRGCFTRYCVDTRAVCLILVILASLTLAYCGMWLYTHHLFVSVRSADVLAFDTGAPSAHGHHHKQQQQQQQQQQKVGRHHPHNGKARMHYPLDFASASASASAYAAATYDSASSAGRAQHRSPVASARRLRKAISAVDFVEQHEQHQKGQQGPPFPSGRARHSNGQTSSSSSSSPSVQLARPMPKTSLPAARHHAGPRQ